MDKKKAILLLMFCVVAIPVTSGFATEISREVLLWDGFVLTGVEGKLISAVSQSGGELFFEFDKDVSDLRVKAPAGTKLRLLPSLTLDKLIADVGGRSENTYRLSGWVTKYKGENFIFPNYFLPVSIRAGQKSQAERKSEKDSGQQAAGSDPGDLLAMPEEIRERLSDQIIVRPRASGQTSGTERMEKVDEDPPGAKAASQTVVGDPNDLLAMPKEISERLSDRRIVRPRTERQAPKTKKIDVERDTVLADRSAFLVERSNGQPVFVLDALGRNTRPVSLRLLPCEALELAELIQSAVPEPVRFKIAGIVTKYKGEEYLLLQKAVRVYSFGNFAR
ncbi:MAG: hypothetical protein JW837_14435 [Sedimentisphaerales bacterium]|nr:hypothetical protein [Sedimentisphaerales bacterium]